MLKYKRGTVWMARLRGEGHIQDGDRPVLIYSNDTANFHSPIVHIIPLSTRIEKSLPVHYLVKANDGLRFDSHVLCEQLMPMNKTDIQRYVGTLSEEDMKGVEACVKTQFGITNKAEFGEIIEVVDKYIKDNKPEDEDVDTTVLKIARKLDEFLSSMASKKAEEAKPQEGKRAYKRWTDEEKSEFLAIYASEGQKAAATAFGISLPVAYNNYKRWSK